MTRYFSPFGWAALATAILLVAATGYYVLGRPAVKAKTEATMAQGRVAAGADAVGVVVHNGDKAATIDTRVEGSQNAIRNAPVGAGDSIALRELCKSPSARNQPHCVQQPSAGSVGAGRAVNGLPRS